MTTLDQTAACDPRDASAQALFQHQWRIYRLMVDHNYLFHREAYACLHRVVVAEAARPFRFLDVACGDAGPTVGALRGTPVAHYHGIDLSQTALDLARPTLSALDCPVTLERRDFVAALRERTEPADVAWIGLSLHHLPTSMKLETLRALRGLVGEGGLLLVYEVTSRDGEDRNAWLGRWEAQQPHWTAFSPQDWEAATDHVRAADFPETISGWRALGHEAGFGAVRELFVAPTDLIRMYAFSARDR